MVIGSPALILFSFRELITHLQNPPCFWKEAPRKCWRALETYSSSISACVDFNTYFHFSWHTGSLPSLDKMKILSVQQCHGASVGIFQLWQGNYLSGKKGLKVILALCARNALLSHHVELPFFIFQSDRPDLLYEKKNQTKTIRWTLFTKVSTQRCITRTRPSMIYRRSYTPWSTSWSAKHGCELHYFLGTHKSPLQLSETAVRFPDHQIILQTRCTRSCKLMCCTRWVQRGWFHHYANLCTRYLEITELHLHHF